MAKPKFVLTSDLVKVEPEPVLVQASPPSFDKAFQKESAPSHTDPVPFSSPMRANENQERVEEKSADTKNLPLENSATTQPHPLYDTPSGTLVRELSPPQPSHHAPVSPHLEPYHSPDVLRTPPVETSFGAPSKTPPVSLRESSLFLRMRESNQPSVVRDQFNLKIDRDLKRDFRLWCLLREISMTEALEDAIRFYMEKIDRMER